MTSLLSWLAKAQSLTNTPFRPSCPALATALRHVEAGQFIEASEAVRTLNDVAQRRFATLVIELRAAAAAAVENNNNTTEKTTAAIAALVELCRANDRSGLHDNNAADHNGLPRDLFETWARTVGPRLPVEMLVDRDKFFSCHHGGRLLRAVVDAHCDAGQWAAAAVVARRLVHSNDVEEMARQWARIGLGLPAGSGAREEALMIAAKAGNARPKIQHGGEEAAAHGAAIEAFARGKLRYDHPAVRTAVQGFRF
jgi:hypothetical protein